MEQPEKPIEHYRWLLEKHPRLVGSHVRDLLKHITLLENELILTRAESEALGSELLILQQDYIQLLNWGDEGGA
jgi:hypothetical protein